MSRMKNAGFVLCGLVLGLAMSAPAAQAAESLKVALSTNRILVDGQQVQMTAYTINGNNYVKLRDVGEAVDFNVYWDSEKGCVQIESDKPYTGTAPAKSETAEAAPQTDTDAMKMDIVEQTNAIRTEKGAAALIVNEKLMQAAQVRADEMAATGLYSHTRPDGRQYYTVTDCPYTAENIHQIADWQIKDGNLADFAIREWAESPGHLKNMLNSRLSEIGVGLARGTNIIGDPCWYCVQLFLYDGNTVHSVDAPATIK